VNTAVASKRQRGNALIEFALSFCLLFSVFAGIFQFSYSFYVYNTLVMAVREGARYASLKPYDSTTVTPTSTFQTAVQNMVIYGDADPAQGARPVVAGLTNANVTVVPTGGASGTLTAPTQISVSITNFRVDSAFGAWTLINKPNATFPYTGILTPP
jgi:Flp pilus assembly protein TadG